jgi:hypothetical protein
LKRSNYVRTSRHLNEYLTGPLIFYANILRTKLGLLIGLSTLAVVATIAISSSLLLTVPLGLRRY